MTATDHTRSLAVAVARISASDKAAANAESGEANAESMTAVQENGDEDAQPKLHNPAP